MSSERHREHHQLAMRFAMTTYRRRTGYLVTFLLVALTVPQGASAARVQRSFARTYPHATKLCARAAGQKLPVKLQPSSAQISAACTTLRSSFTAAQTIYANALTAVRHQQTSAAAKLRNVCNRSSSSTAACRRQLLRYQATLRNLRVDVLAAVKAYQQAVITARDAFWATIRALPGGAGPAADTATPPARVPKLPYS